MEPSIEDKIKILQTKIAVEHDQIKKQEFERQLRVLQYRKEIEVIRKKIAQLS